jgi:Fibronectin type III domain
MTSARAKRPAWLGLAACLWAALLLPDGPAAAADCNAAPPKPVSSDVVVKLDPGTAWQPRGGQIRIVVESATQLLKGTDVTVCFRWSSGKDALYLPATAVQVAESTPTKAVYRAIVPELKRVESSWFDRLGGKLPADPTQPTQFDNGGIVPVADVKVIVGTADSTLATAVLEVGVTSVWNAVLVTLVCVLGAQGLLYAWAVSRKVPGRSPWMRLIATREGYASLSQAQIVLWSFLFGAGATYVMILSGSLIDIPTSALVLLGIAGATTVGAMIQGANAQTASSSPSGNLPTAGAVPATPLNLVVIASDDHSVTLQWDPPAAGAMPAVYAVSYARQAFADWRVSDDLVKENSHRVSRLLPDTTYVFQVTARNDKGASPPAQVTARTRVAAVIPRQPVWSDLVVTPQHPGEIDVTRVQMLFFTLISVAFVAIKLINSYTIPDIPEGFMLLMGISNGVYLSAKFVHE